ncbi:MAG: V-type ATP synthase subunit E [Thermoflexaceae bacterium]|nr:V-type ATP synthase subunit E [Thermoflexaceae bacterium]
MTVEEKLSHFFDSSVGEARRQSEAAITEYKDILEKDFEEYKKHIDSQAETRLKLEETSIRRELNHDLSVRLLQVKKELSDKHDELKNALFSEVKQLLNDFHTSDEYKSLIEKQIADALAFAGEDPITVYIDPSDNSLITDLSKKFNCQIIVSDYPFGGGIRAVIEEKHILIDHSFDTRFDEIFEDFIFNGGSLNE